MSENGTLSIYNCVKLCVYDDISIVGIIIHGHYLTALVYGNHDVIKCHTPSCLDTGNMAL